VSWSAKVGSSSPHVSVHLVLLRVALRSIWLGGDLVGGPAVVWYRGWWRGCRVVASFSSRMDQGCVLGGVFGPSYTFIRGGVAWG